MVGQDNGQNALRRAWRIRSENRSRAFPSLSDAKHVTTTVLAVMCQAVRITYRCEIYFFPHGTVDRKHNTADQVLKDNYVRAP